MTVERSRSDLIFSHGRVERAKIDPDNPCFLESDRLAEWNNTGGPRHVPGIHVAINFERLPSIQFSHGFGAWKQDRLSSHEIGLIRFLNYITDQENWQHNVFDFDIVREWKEIAIPRYFQGHVIWEWCIFELLKKAKEYTKAPQFILALDYASAVCKSDRLVHTSLLDLLKKSTKDRSTSPWLYPFVFAQSPLRADGVRIDLDNFVATIGRGIVPPRPFWDTDDWSGEMQFYSNTSQWLASDIRFAGNGNAVQFVSPINNLHPRRHRLLYSAIEHLIGDSIPEWNQVLLYKSLPRNGPRIKAQRRRCRSCTIPSRSACSCAIKLNKSSEWSKGTTASTTQSPTDSEIWNPTLAMDGKYPSARKLYDNISLSRAFRDRGLQVYVELFKIEMQTDGSIPVEHVRRFDWDLNGNRNERIVATTLVCLEQSNIKEGSLKISFRSETTLKTWGEHGSMAPPTTPSSPVIGDATTPRFQELVAVNIPEGRIVTYPNAVQHKLLPFRLADGSKTGHVQLLAVHLADPHYLLSSTRHVPQQSVAWWWEASNFDLICVQHRIPPELRKMLVDFAIGEGSGAPPEEDEEDEEDEESHGPRFSMDHAPERPQEERPIRIEAAMRRRVQAFEEHRRIIRAVNGPRIYGVPGDLRQSYRALSQVTMPLDQSEADKSGYPLVNTVPADADGDDDGGTQQVQAPGVQATQAAQAAPGVQASHTAQTNQTVQSGQTLQSSQTVQAGPSGQSMHTTQLGQPEPSATASHAAANVLPADNDYEANGVDSDGDYDMEEDEDSFGEEDEYEESGEESDEACSDEDCSDEGGDDGDDDGSENPTFDEPSHQLMQELKESMRYTTDRIPITSA